MKAILPIAAVLLAANESSDIWLNLAGVGLMALCVILSNREKRKTMNEDFKISDKSSDPDLNTPRMALAKLSVSSDLSAEGRQEVIDYLNEM